jgi:hypothetical protein
MEEHRALTVYGPDGELRSAVGRRPAFEFPFPAASVEPDHRSPTAARPIDRDAAAAELLRGHLEYRGPPRHCPNLRTRRGCRSRTRQEADGVNQLGLINLL